MLHDSAKSHSLLRQLRIKQRMRLISSSPIMPRGQTVWLGLVVIQLTPHWIEYLPKCEDASPRSEFPAMPLDRWWTQKVIRARDDRDGWFTLRRQDLILGFANRDGGAHIDPRPRARHTPSIGTAISIAVANTISGRHEPTHSVAHLCIRQMAWEFEQSLNAYEEELH